MKKQILIVLVAAFCGFESWAQIKIPGSVTGGSADGTNFGIPASTIILGNGNSTGNSNVYIGNGTATTSSAAGSNTFVGHSVSPNNQGQANTFIGQSVGFSNTSGWANSFFGAWTGGSNTTGTANTFLGQYCGISNTTGSGNIFIGQGCATNSSTAGDNTIVGTGAAGNNTTGNGNVFVGRVAGVGNINGSANTALGTNAGFSSGSLTNATAIGANARSAVSNSMILGPDGVSGTRVNVGIGTSSPGAHLHTVTNGFENVIFSTTSANSSSNLSMRANYNNVNLFVYGNAASGIYLPAVGAAPAVPNAAMAGLVTGAGEPLTIGVDGYEHSGSIYFNNMVANSSGSVGRTECMRIDNPTGFVGIHTRQTGNGRPQALLHVNLTNPVNSNLNPLTQGIRFQGLPAAQHPDVIVVDANGNLARRAYPTGGGGAETDPLSWHLAGNTISPGEFIGTLNNLDFVIKTNNTQRARVTNDGNLDFGANSISSSTTSAAVGSNAFISVTSSIASGDANTIDNSDYSAAFGQGNIIQTGSLSSQATGTQNDVSNSDYSVAAGKDNVIQLSQGVFAAGQGHQITNSFSVAALGGRDEIKNSNESTVSGEDNKLFNAHGSFIGGGHNIVDGSYDFVGGRHNNVMGSFNFVGGDQNQANGNFNFALGFHLVADNASTTPVSPDPTDPNAYLMVIGERINSNLNRSLSVGFNGNRTTVTTERGMSVQIDPASGSTDIPVANFEVEAGVGTTGRQPLGGPLQSNIRFHNLPPDPQGRALPAVLIDPATGELFLSQGSYMKPGKASSDVELDSLFLENEALKNRVTELESKLAEIPALQAQLATYDEKFAQLERALNQICESGCAGLDGSQSDALYQSTPNPTDGNARINYHLSRNYSEASIVLYTTDGREIRTYTLTPGKGDGYVDVALDDVLPGTYLYRLIVDGKAIAVKKLQKQ